MKALSYRQPWAYSVIHFGKPIENRDWTGCSFRGPTLVHASKSVGTIDDFDDAVDTIVNDVVKPEAGPVRLAMLKPFARMEVAMRGIHHGEGTWKPAATLPLGGIVGRVNVIGTVDAMGMVTERQTRRKITDDEARWWARGFGLLLADPEPLPFIPYKGALGFFNVDDAWLANQLALGGA